MTFSLSSLLYQLMADSDKHPQAPTWFSLAI